MKKLLLLFLLLCSSCSVTQEFVVSGDHVKTQKYNNLYINYYRRCTILSSYPLDTISVQEYMYKLNGPYLYSIENPDSVLAIKKYK